MGKKVRRAPVIIQSDRGYTKHEEHVQCENPKCPNWVARGLRLCTPCKKKAS